jgi:UMF1 family MFS transporter
MSWIAFDPVTSAYVAIVPSVLFPVYFQKLIAGGGISLAWGGLVAAAIVGSGVAAFAAVALMRIIPRFWLLCGWVALLVANTFVLSIPAAQSPWIPALAFVVAQASYSAAMTTYESFLPTIARSGEIHRISGLGWSVGFTGGIIGIFLLIWIVDDNATGTALYRDSFFVIAALTAALALPVLFFMYRRGFSAMDAPRVMKRHAAVWTTMKNWRVHRRTLTLLFSAMLIYSATAVVVNFTAPILTGRFGTSFHDLLYLLLVVQVLSVPSTYLIGELSQRWSRRVPIFLLLSGWGVVLVLLACGSHAWMIWIIVAVLGCCAGATNATMRSFLVESIPTPQAGVFFGLFAVAGRISSAAGPMVFVMVAKSVGERYALLLMCAILLSGASVLFAYLRQK